MRPVSVSQIAATNAAVRRSILESTSQPCGTPLCRARGLGLSQLRKPPTQLSEQARHRSLGRIGQRRRTNARQTVACFTHHRSGARCRRSRRKSPRRRPSRSRSCPCSRTRRPGSAERKARRCCIPCRTRRSSCRISGSRSRRRHRSGDGLPCTRGTRSSRRHPQRCTRSPRRAGLAGKRSSPRRPCRRSHHPRRCRARWDSRPRRPRHRRRPHRRRDAAV